MNVVRRRRRAAGGQRESSGRHSLGEIKVWYSGRLSSSGMSRFVDQMRAFCMVRFGPSVQHQPSKEGARCLLISVESGPALASRQERGETRLLPFDGAECSRTHPRVWQP